MIGEPLPKWHFYSIVTLLVIALGYSFWHLSTELNTYLTVKPLTGLWTGEFTVFEFEIMSSAFSGLGLALLIGLILAFEVGLMRIVPPSYFFIAGIFLIVILSANSFLTVYARWIGIFAPTSFFESSQLIYSSLIVLFCLIKLPIVFLYHHLYFKPKMMKEQQERAEQKAIALQKE